VGEKLIDRAGPAEALREFTDHVAESENADHRENDHEGSHAAGKTGERASMTAAEKIGPTRH